MDVKAGQIQASHIDSVKNANKWVNRPAQVKVKYVRVSFPTAMQHYDFICLVPNVTKGDRVVVDTARGEQVGKVVAVLSSSSQATKHVIGKVDTTAYDYYHGVRGELEKSRKRLDQLSNNLKTRDRVLYWSQLASVDERIADELVNFYNTEVACEEMENLLK